MEYPIWRKENLDIPQFKSYLIKSFTLNRDPRKRENRLGYETIEKLSVSKSIY